MKRLNPILHLIIWIFITFYFSQCVPIPNYSSDSTDSLKTKKIKVFETKNLIYEEQIKTVQLYPMSNDIPDYLSGSVVFKPIQNLVLEFDELGEDFNEYRAKLIHCNFDWTQSMLNDIEFLNEINDFPIQQRELSFNTRKPYVHYTFNLPKVKVSGNYVIKVYREGDKSDIMLSRRFIVYDNKIHIEPKVRPSNAPSERERNQQVEFKINYGAFPNISNPKEEVKVVLRQNKRWQNAITTLKPLYVREVNKVLEYTHFKQENNFKGLNEYRYFDARSVRFLGFNIARVNVKRKLAEVWVGLDQNRANRSYLRRKDNNGGFVISHYETGKGTLESDYIMVHFSLSSQSEVWQDLYIVGGFCDWEAKEEYKLRYDSKTKTYQTSILLKQGIYDYAYAVKDKNTGALLMNKVEGAYQETENDYDIIVYYRPPGQRNDLVLGYRKFNSLD